MTSPRPRRHSPRVYRRRRAVVLLGLVAVVVVVLLIILRPGLGSGSGAPPAANSVQTTAPTGAAGAATPVPSPAAPDAAGAATSTTAPAAPPPAASSAAASPSSGGAAAPAASAAADGSAPCAAGNITVTPVTDSNSYSSGSLPQLSFSIVNTGSTPCTINAGTSKQVYTITSGSETYWTSTDCQTNAADTAAMLAPGVAVTSTPFAWNRVRSSPSTCNGTQPSVPAGGASYHLNVSIDGIASATSAQFLLY